MANEKLSQALAVRQLESLSKQETVECVPVQPLSDYEMDAMWMSYRYALGDIRLRVSRMQGDWYRPFIIA